MSQKHAGTKGKQRDHLCYGDPGPGAEAGAPVPPALRWDRAPGWACGPGMLWGKDPRRGCTQHLGHKEQRREGRRRGRLRLAAVCRSGSYGCVLFLDFGLKLRY